MLPGQSPLASLCMGANFQCFKMTLSTNPDVLMRNYPEASKTLTGKKSALKCAKQSGSYSSRDVLRLSTAPEDAAQKVLRNMVASHRLSSPEGPRGRASSEGAHIVPEEEEKEKSIGLLMRLQVFHPIKPRVKSFHRIGGDIILLSPDGPGGKACQEGGGD